MTTLRILLPYIIGCFGILIFLWFIGWQIVLKNGKETLDADEYTFTQKVVKRVYYTIFMLMVIGLVVKAVSITATNEIPRSVIDRTTPDQMRENFEDRMKKNAEKAKVTNDSIKQLNN